MAHDYSVIDDDNRFIIDGDTREITNLTGNRPSLMQFDHNCEILTFQMPRIMEGHDMSLCDEVKVLYRNTGSGTSVATRPVAADVEPINDMMIDEDGDSNIVFSWTIPEFATIYSGTLIFQFKFVCNGDTEDAPPKFKLYTEQYSFVEVRPSLDVSKNLNTQFPTLIDEINSRLRTYNAELAEAIQSLKDAKDNGEFTGPQGPEGPEGKPFTIAKVYENIDQMERGCKYDGVPIGGYVIVSGEAYAVDESQRGRLYVKTTDRDTYEPIYEYLFRMGYPEVATPTSIDLSAFDTEGKIVETYGNGTIRTTTMEFDEAGNPIKITDPDGNVTELVW